MRAWYHTKLGFSANLCQMLYRESTRLIVSSPEHTPLHFEVYPTWQSAVDALKSIAVGEGWISDLTGEPLQ